MTAEESAHLAFGSARSSQVVEPLTNYAVMQAKREWSNQSSLGFMFTGTTRRLTDEVAFLPSSAMTGGVNWDWRLKDPRYSVAGYWAGSTVHGSTEAIATPAAEPRALLPAPGRGPPRVRRRTARR